MKNHNTTNMINEKNISFSEYETYELYDETTSSDEVTKTEDEFLKFTVEAEDNGKRLDVFLSEKTEKSRSFIQKLSDEGKILVDDKQRKKNYSISFGEEIKIYMPSPKSIEILAEDIPLDIVFEDEHLLVVNKPKGMVVHPAPGNYSGTLVNALMHHCGDSLSGINGVIRPGIVHRIDKDTSGLLIVAKNDEAHRGLAEQIAVHSFQRIYEAVVIGNLKEDSFRIDLPIGRHPTDRKKMTVIYENSKNAVTNVEVIKRFGKYTHIRCKLETGRTHQIRVHLAHKGHSILGDEVYGTASKAFPKLQGQCLFARHIGFVHPISKEFLSFDAPMPLYFTKILSALENL